MMNETVDFFNLKSWSAAQQFDSLVVLPLLNFSVSRPNEYTFHKGLYLCLVFLLLFFVVVGTVAVVILNGQQIISSLFPIFCLCLQQYDFIIFIHQI
jgi:hypothetical protein